MTFPQQNKSVVVVIDDDESVRAALQAALQSIGLETLSFSSAEAFLQSGVQAKTGCLITDLQMPGMTGLELQATLARSDERIPIIFISAFGEPRMRDRALQAGAIEFFDKPFDDAVLLQTVRTIIEA